MKNQEVEIRALLPDKDENFHDELIQTGASKIGESILEDWYYCPNHVTDFSEIEMKEIGTYSLRIRKSTGFISDEGELNVKIISRYDDHSSWEEQEVKVSSVEEMKKILRSIGFKKYFEIRKERTDYILGELNISVEKIKGLGYAIEVEIMTTREKSSEAKNKIRKFLSRLNINPDNAVPKSITNILMRKLSKF
ncbi:class IV adenylate cyclase [uncultured Croceitalea sp.]|uniref:class IV adenylate cyclase n=1 Tax=uncultured Croceitalea sp. TaxID=1798908 RepID=UPI00374E6A6C